MSYPFAPIILIVTLCLAGNAYGVTDQRGEKIYRTQCASCHGTKGQGVEGKYEQSLTGDLTAEALAEIISDTMPAEDPDRCVAEDATAVAQYMMETFYSPAARAKTMTGIELTHRTNLQYKNSIADLLARFSGKIWIEPGMTNRGYKGQFYTSRNFDSTKKSGERVDPEIKFQFGNGSPLSPDTQCEEFAAHWHAALQVQETGRYDFFVDTPNGFKLYINDPRKPLIDAWVTSGETSYEASAYLLAGQSYLIKVDMFKYKEKDAQISLHWKPPFGKRESIPTERLIPVWAPRVGITNTALPPDDSSSGYERGTSVSKAWLEGTAESAIEISNFILSDLEKFAGVRKETPDKREKLKQFCRRLASFAFCRPLTEPQKLLYVDSQFTDDKSDEEAAKQSIILILQSPRFLYPELGVEHVDDHAVAARLALMMWDSMPDQQLWSAANGGNLVQPWGIRAQVDRMIDDPRTQAKVRGFFQRWLQMNEEDITKDKDRYPDFNADIAADLRTSLNLFLDDVVWSDDSDFRRLYTSNELFVNPRLSDFYQIPLEPNSPATQSQTEVQVSHSTPDTSQGYTRVETDPALRAGVLTHPYMMTGLAYHRTSSPIHRGVFVARKLIGRALKQPPENFEPLKEDFDPSMTTRQRVAHQTKHKTCQTCHSFINPLGFSLEGYDAVGRIRTREKDQPINTRSTYFTEDQQTVELNGPRELAEYLIASEKAQRSFVENLFHHFVKHSSRSYGPDVLDRLHRSFVEHQFNIKQLIKDIVTLASLQGTDVQDKLQIGQRTSNPTNPAPDSLPSPTPSVGPPSVEGVIENRGEQS